jgi:hypothetical protein
MMVLEITDLAQDLERIRNRAPQIPAFLEQPLVLPHVIHSANSYVVAWKVSTPQRLGCQVRISISCRKRNCPAPSTHAAAHGISSCFAELFSLISVSEIPDRIA